MSSTKLYRVSAMLTAEKFHIAVHEWDAVEKKELYWVSRTNEWDEVLKRRIRKEQIGRIEAGRFEINLKTVQYQVWCHEDNIEEFKADCTRVVIKTVKRFQEQLDALLKNLPKTPQK